MTIESPIQRSLEVGAERSAAFSGRNLLLLMFLPGGTAGYIRTPYLMRDYVDTRKDSNLRCLNSPQSIRDVNGYEDHYQSTKIAITLRPRTLSYTSKRKSLNISIQLI